MYGFKIRRLLRLCSSAIRDVNATGAAKLSTWQALPAESTEHDEAVVVCVPEFDIASAMVASCAADPQQDFTVLQLLKICDDLSTAYSRWNDYNSERVLTLQTQIIKVDLLPKGLSFSVWVLIVRLLLRSVTMGVGTATVMAASGRPAWIFESQHDLAAVSRVQVGGAPVSSWCYAG